MSVNWEQINKSLSSTPTEIITIQDTLASLGINDINVCDADSVIQALNKLIDNWWEDVKKSIDNISYEMVGNFLTALGILLSRLLSSAAAAVTDIFLIEILSGNLLNSIVSAVVFALALLPGGEIILQYYLIYNLKRDLIRRAELGNILYKQTNIIIELLSSFYNLFKFDEDLLYTDLKKALKNIRKAEAILGREISKNFYGEQPLILDQISRVDYYIEKAINNLTHENYDVVYNYIRLINNEYGIVADLPKGLDVFGWTLYFNNIQTQVSSRFFTYTNEYGTREYDNEVNMKNMQYRQFISAMIKIMPPILQRIILNATFKDASKIIFERIPVWANNIKLLKDLKKILDNSVSVPNKFLDTYLSMNNVSKTPDPQLFRNPATKDITWRNITSKISLEEAGVLLFPSYWKYIQNVGGILQNMLLPVMTILKNVDSEIESVLNKQTNLSIAELSVNQFKWISELNGARTILATLINTQTLRTDYAKINLDPITIYNTTVQSEIAINKLKQFIRDKYFDSKTNTSKVQAADTVYEVAQKYLGNLLLNIYIIVNPVAAKNTITGLQAMKTGLRKQIIEDKREIILCSNFLNIVETNPLFKTFKPYLDKLLNDLEQTRVGNSIAKQIKTGDLSGIINILEGYWAVNNVEKLLNCESKKSGEIIDSSKLGLDLNVNIEVANKIERSLSQLRDQQNIILDTIPKIMEQLDSL